MKQKLKKLKLLLTISLAGLLLNSCQEEFDESYNQSKNSNFVKEFTFKQASQKPKFNNAYNKFASGLDKMKRTNKSIDSDFEIDSTLVKEVTLNNQTTYTMAIKRAIPNDRYFENLIVQVKNGDSTRAYIAKYTPTKEMVYFQSHNSYTYAAASEFKEIVFDTSGFQNKITLVCFSVMVCDYGGTVHIAGEHCSNISDGTGCFEVSSGDSSGPGDGSDGLSSSSGGSSSGGSSSGGVPTAPVPVPVPPPTILNEDPCPKLIPLLAEPKITAAIAFVKPQTTGKSEFGYAVSRTRAYDPATNTDVYTTNTQFIAGSNKSVEIPTGGSVAGGIHNHPLNGGAYPSWGDINWLLSCENNNFPSNDGTAFAIVVVKDPQNAGQTITYAITIGNLAALQTQIDADMAKEAVLKRDDFDDKNKYLVDFYGKKFNGLDGNTAACETKFLQVFNNYGINLSKLDPTTNKWNTLNLETPFDPKRPNALNSALPTPCN